MTENNFIQDPWAKMTTRNGLQGDEVITEIHPQRKRKSGL